MNEAALHAAPSAVDYDVQSKLSSYYRRQLRAPEHCLRAPTPSEAAAVWRLEDNWMDQEERRCDPGRLPTGPTDFEAWYRGLFRQQLAEGAPFFDYLADRASLEEMAFYVCLEEQVDGRFDDVIALAQLGLENQAKLALARNYWDEMGEGRQEAMHTWLFEESASYFRPILNASPLAAGLETTVEALKNSNLLLMMAFNRRHALRLLGAITLLEHTAPYRFARTVKGMRRLGAPESAIHYHEMHIRVDARHGDDLLNEVLTPMIARQPDVVQEIAFGMLIRFNTATDYYAGIARTMRLELGPHPGATAP